MRRIIKGATVNRERKERRQGGYVLETIPPPGF